MQQEPGQSTPTVFNFSCSLPPFLADISSSWTNPLRLLQETGFKVCLWNTIFLNCPDHQGGSDYSCLSEVMLCIHFCTNKKLHSVSWHFHCGISLLLTQEAEITLKLKLSNVHSSGLHESVQELHDHVQNRNHIFGVWNWNHKLVCIKHYVHLLTFYTGTTATILF